MRFERKGASMQSASMPSVSIQVAGELLFLLDTSNIWSVDLRFSLASVWSSCIRSNHAPPIIPSTHLPSLPPVMPRGSVSINTTRKMYTQSDFTTAVACASKTMTSKRVNGLGNHTQRNLSVLSLDPGRGLIEAQKAARRERFMEVVRYAQLAQGATLSPCDGARHSGEAMAAACGADARWSSNSCFFRLAAAWSR
ncbi:hypothetical protein BKA80DRAFT_271408 [Phyllosticta citrichinensis]